MTLGTGLRKRDHVYEKEAYVTLATNDQYGYGCLVLARSLLRTDTKRQLVVMVTSGISSAMNLQLQSAYDLVYPIDVQCLDDPDPVNLALVGRPDLHKIFTKLQCWRLTQYTKAVYMDADTLVMKNIDDLFDCEEISAWPYAGPGWPDCFNPSVFVYKPSQDMYHNLVQFALKKKSFGGGDLELLNLYFSDWPTKDNKKHLPFVCNDRDQFYFSYLPAFAKFRENVRIIHFVGALKPWHNTYNQLTGEVTLHPRANHDIKFLKMWWTIFLQDIQPIIHARLSCCHVAVKSEPVPEPEEPQEIVLEQATDEPEIILEKISEKDPDFEAEEPEKEPEPEEVKEEPIEPEEPEILEMQQEEAPEPEPEKEPEKAEVKSIEEPIEDPPVMMEDIVEVKVTKTEEQLPEPEKVVEIEPEKILVVEEKPLELPKIKTPSPPPEKPVLHLPPVTKVNVASQCYVKRSTGTQIDTDFKLPQIASARVDVDNPGMIYTKITTDKGSAARFKIKSINSPIARSEYPPDNKVYRFTGGNDDVKMTMEFNCAYKKKSNICG